MSTRNKFGILIGIILVASLAYYLLSTPRDKDMVLIGTVDGNQVIVSPQIQGRHSKLLGGRRPQVKQGDLIAVLDPSELEAEERRPPPTSPACSKKWRKCGRRSKPPRDPLPAM